MALPKPSDPVTWGNAGTSPNGGQKSTGFSVADRPPAAWFNWFWYTVSSWFLWLTQYFTTSGTSDRDLAIAPTALGTLSVAGGVGTGGTGGAVTIAGGAAESGTNKDGGDLNLAGGATTGTASTNVVIKAATAGSSGTGANTPEAYITADGSTGKVSVPKEIASTKKITATKTSTNVVGAEFTIVDSITGENRDYGEAAISATGSTGSPGTVGVHAKASGQPAAIAEQIGAGGPAVLVVAGDSSNYDAAVEVFAHGTGIEAHSQDGNAVIWADHEDAHGRVLHLRTGATGVHIHMNPTTSDPTQPNDGDMWCTGSALKVRVNGVTYTLAP